MTPALLHLLTTERDARDRRRRIERLFAAIKDIEDGKRSVSAVASNNLRKLIHKLKENSHSA